MMIQRPRDLGMGCWLPALALVSVTHTPPLCDHLPIYVSVCEDGNRTAEQRLVLG